MYDDILLATHTGEENAINHAIDIAKTYQAKLHVLYAADPSTLEALSGDISDLIQKQEEEGKTIIEEVSKTASEKNVEVETTVVDRVPHEAIHNYAKNHEIDLIVMGAGRKDRLRPSLLGGVTEKVLRTSKTPVLTIK